MNIYYNIKSQSRCNEQGIRLSGDFPLICFKQQPEWILNLLDENGKPYDLTGIEAFRAAVDVDFSHSTTPVIRTLDENIDKSQKADGILKILLNANTVNFQQAVDNTINKKAYFELWGLDQNAQTKLYVIFEIRISSVIDPDGGELPEEVPSDYMTVTQVQAIFRTADELQFTSDTADDTAAHADQVDSDTHFRYRNPAAGGDWSPWIKLPVGVKGDRGETGISVANVEQTETSEESSGVNKLTITMSDNTEYTFIVRNGAKGEKGDSFTFDAIGTLAGKDAYNDEAKGFAYLDTENGNIYIKNSDTSADWAEPLPFRGEQGEPGEDGTTPTIGENGNWFIGETDTGVKAGSNGYTRTVVSSNTTAQTGYWYVCTSAVTITLPAGSTGAYIRISTDYNTTGVIVATTNGETIDGDAEGFTLDKTSGTVEVFWNGSGWTVIEAK